jgi:cyclopropane-fatty-acyl-phospholipid synthase
MTHQPVASERTNVAQRTTRAMRATRAALAELFGPVAGRQFAIRFWDGTVDAPSLWTRVSYTLVLRDPGALRAMLLPPSEYQIGAAFVSGVFDVDGDLIDAAALGEQIRARLADPGVLLRVEAQLLRLPSSPRWTDDGARALGAAAHRRQHSRARDRAAIMSHYDVSNDFYALWLDQRMIYSCGYFPTGIEDIDTAQTAKIDLICRKLRLQPGERLLDIGCGWGGLALYAAQHFGVTVRGITLSTAQAVLAKQRIAAAGLTGLCTVELCDYRELRGEMFDKVVSVGMFEHVGRRHLPEYFAAAHRLLRPGGLFLNHGIVTRDRDGDIGLLGRITRHIWGHGGFMDRFVFPDGELVPVATAIAGGEAAGLEVRDVESLREHYALTLQEWIRRLQAARGRATAIAGEATVRTWLLYMAACVHAFRHGHLSLAQVLFARPDEHGHVDVPATRADIYDVRQPPVAASYR